MPDLEKEQSCFFPVFKRFPVDIDRGEGIHLIDKKGNRYLDLLGGIAVNALGYNHPDILQAVNRQLSRNLHLSHYFLQDIQVEFAEYLLRHTPFSTLFLTNSGTEAVEGLIKLARKYGKSSGKDQIIAFEGSFHGRSMGALSLTMQEKYQRSFKPLLPNIISIPFNDVSAFNEAVSSRTAAVFFEGIQGEGGIRPISKEMLRAVSAGRERFGFLVMMDEIQTGIGRTGKIYYFEHCDFIPDAIASAKGLGGGLPLGAFLVKDELRDVFAMGEHGSTYGGNPLACAAGLAVIKNVCQQEFLIEVQEKGDYFYNRLCEIKSQFNDSVTEVRGKGLMLGMELREKAFEVLNLAIKNKLIFNVAGVNTLRFVPPLIIKKSEIDRACEIIFSILKQTFH